MPSPYNPAVKFEKVARKKKELDYVHSVWSVQNIIYEIVQNHLLTNDPQEMGYGFKQKYAIEKEKSDILLDISYNWKADSAQKRPAIFISRKPVEVNSSKTIGQGIGSNVAESEWSRVSLVTVPIGIMCIAHPLGFAEQWADYIKYPFMYFAQEIQEEYCLHKVRLVKISSPEIISIDAKDAFGVELLIVIEYYDTWTILKDDLKFKTFKPTFLDVAGVEYKNI